MTTQYLKKASKTSSTGEDDARATVADMLRDIEEGGEPRALHYAESLDGWKGDVIVSKEDIATAAKSVPEQRPAAWPHGGAENCFVPMTCANRCTEIDDMFPRFSCRSEPAPTGGISGATAMQVTGISKRYLVPAHRPLHKPVFIEVERQSTSPSPN